MLMRTAASSNGVIVDGLGYVSRQCYQYARPFQGKPVADIINLRRARKARARGEKAREAESNRVKHGVSKAEHDLATARAEKAARVLESGKLDDEDSQ
jgi:hypothetical protein